MEKKNTELEKLFQQENIYPVKKKAIPMLKGFQDVKPVFEAEPYVYYDIDLEAKQKMLSAKG